MTKESLDKALDIIIEGLGKSDIQIQDKVELMLNLSHFLNPDDYDKNIYLLTVELEKKRREYYVENYEQYSDNEQITLRKSK